MGSRERRSREREATRQRILDAAREMFVQHGYEATTMRAIAARIEYTPTAIYHHFRNKEALLTELCGVDFRSLASAFVRIGRIDDPIERLRQIGRAYVEFALTHPMQYQLLFMTRHPDVSAGQGVERGNPAEDAYAFLREACESAIASGRIRPDYGDPEELAQMLWSAKHGILALQIVKEGMGWVEWRDARTTAERLGDLVIESLTARPP